MEHLSLLLETNNLADVEKIMDTIKQDCNIDRLINSMYYGELLKNKHSEKYQLIMKKYIAPYYRSILKCKLDLVKDMLNNSNSNIDYEYIDQTLDHLLNAF